MTLEYERLRMPDLILFRPKIFQDERGYFFEKYRRSEYGGLNVPDFVQDNCSLSKRGVIRGLHYQLPPFAQGKLVSVVKGRIWDVAVDIREHSKTLGKWLGVELSEENNHLLYIPAGFAHGFSVLSDEARVIYKCTNEYSKEHERGIRFDDPRLNIDWKIAN